MSYQIDPWRLRWQGLALDQLRRTESTFALANGHIGLRGSLDEGEPVGLPGTYLNGFYEAHALPYAEIGYGYPEDGQTIVNVTDGKIIRLLVADEPFDLRYGTTHAHRRTLDFRTGTLDRETEWESPAGQRIQLRSRRLVSLTQRAVAAIQYVVEPAEDTQLVIQSDLLANEPVEPGSADPRVAAALKSPLIADFAESADHAAVLVHHASNSGLRLAAAMDHDIDAPDNIRTDIMADGDLARLTVAVDVPAGERLELIKYLGYGWSARRSAPALHAQVQAALAGARQTGWDGLLAEQRAFLDDFWCTADIEIDGDPELQQAMRFALFHIVQAAVRGEGRAIASKGLTGPGYDGHAFWDTDAFVLPVLTYTNPDAARDALRWRHDTLPTALARAEVLGKRGAAFPWRTISGAECSAYWPAGTAAFHVGAAVADATARYVAATDDRDFERDQGVALLVQTARLWVSIGHYDRHGGFRIDGVTGPDEYTALVDNNVYTNLMAQRNLTEAVEACKRHQESAARLDVTTDELSTWERAAANVVVPFDEATGVHPQSEGFTDHEEWDFAATPTENYPLLLHYPYFDLYRTQVVKQADLVLAMHLRGDAFTPEQKAANFAYYEARTVRDSSLSAGTQAVLAAEVGHLDLALDYLAETVLTDLHDLHDNVHNGLHLAALGGAWLAVVAGLGGMRDHGGTVTFAPRLPPALDRIAFRLSVRGSRVEVAVTAGTATYRLVSGAPLTTRHHGDEIVVDTDPLELPVPPIDVPPAPRQPHGREPRRRASG